LYQNPPTTFCKDVYFPSIVPDQRQDQIPAKIPEAHLLPAPSYPLQDARQELLAAVEEDGFGYSLKNDWERIVNHDGNIDLIVFKAKRGTGVTGRITLKLEKSKMTVRDRIEATKADSVTPLRKKSKFA
jgi:hypothetical protein